MNARYQFRLILYGLKKKFGVQVQMFVPVDKTVDNTTGNVSFTYQNQWINKAPCLPKKHSIQIAGVTTTHNFQNGGQYESAENFLIVDSKDLHLPLKMDNHFLINGVKYKIIGYDSLDADIGYYIGISRLEIAT